MRYEYPLKAQIRGSEVIGADETGIRNNGQIAWVHLARTDELTHLAVHPKRGSTAFEEISIISRFEGGLVRDGYLPNQYYEQCQHSLCNAHLLRNLSFVAENEPAHKEWTDTLAKLLLRIKKAVELVKLNSQSALTSKQQNSYFGRYDRIIIQAERVIRGSPKLKGVHLSAHNLYRRFMTNKEAILRFMTDFRVPFDNNGSERDLQMLKLQQKISGCFRSAAGASVFCRVRSYLSSARKQARSLLAALDSAIKGKTVAL